MHAHAFSVKGSHTQNSSMQLPSTARLDICQPIHTLCPCQAACIMQFCTQDIFCVNFLGFLSFQPAGVRCGVSHIKSLPRPSITR
jgi:hypothetical protein